uniref:Uncharacterized protein n=1 Tax=Setaria viridis TaxID=4556 RepID=A0A4U6ST60_SETVI|nr:hypothetical protein SEVIR_9G138950v2 [Setaria viridis]
MEPLSPPCTPRPASTPKPATRTPTPETIHLHQNPHHCQESPPSSPFTSLDQVDFSFSPSPDHSNGDLDCVRGESSLVQHTDGGRPTYKAALLSTSPTLPVIPTEEGSGQHLQHLQVSSTSTERKKEADSISSTCRSVLLAPNWEGSAPSCSAYYYLGQAAAQICGGRPKRATPPRSLSTGA